MSFSAPRGTLNRLYQPLFLDIIASSESSNFRLSAPLNRNTPCWLAKRDCQNRRRCQAYETFLSKCVRRMPHGDRASFTALFSVASSRSSACRDDS